MPSQYTCAYCGNTFASDRRRRRFCSISCSASAQWAHNRETLPDWFWTRVDKTFGCWLWRSAAKRGNYGLVLGRGAHVVAYELTYGPIPSGLCVCHTCDVRPCVRPDHLFLGTDADNIQDAVRKDRFTPAKLTLADVQAIREAAASGTSQASLARQFSVNDHQVWQIVHRRSWR